MATTTVIQQELSPLLSDYNIHLTGGSSSSNSYTPQALASNTHSQLQNPPNWPADRHRVPDYRPLNRNLNFEERTMGSSAGENVFITVMFTGVFLNATFAKVWGATGGPYFPRLFSYAIGGEW